MDIELTYKVLKYLALGIIVYFALKFLMGERAGSGTDNMIVAMIIVVGYAIVENFYALVTKKSDNAVKCSVDNGNKEHFSLGGLGSLGSSDSNDDSSKDKPAGLGALGGLGDTDDSTSGSLGGLGGLGDSSDSSNQGGLGGLGGLGDSSDGSGSSDDSASGGLGGLGGLGDSSDSSTDSNQGGLGGLGGLGDSSDSSDSSDDSASGGLGGLGGLGSSSGAKTTTEKQTRSGGLGGLGGLGDNSVSDDSATDNVDNASSGLGGLGALGNTDSDAAATSTDESSEESSAEEASEEEIVQKIVQEAEEAPKKIVMDNGKETNVYVTYDNGTVYVKNPLGVSAQNQRLDVNHPNYVPPTYSTVVDATSLIPGMSQQTVVAQEPQVTTKKPAENSNSQPVKAHNTQNIHRSVMRSEAGVMKSEMEYNDYNRLPLDEGVGNKEYEYGYSFMPPEKWYPTPPNPPVCVTEKKCPVCPVYTMGTHMDLKEWDESRRVSQPDNINTRFVMEKLNAGR
jgi:hypothetical protein